MRGLEVWKKLNCDYTNWKHVFKLDPEREISDEALEKICMSGTDAVVVGGSSGVTFYNTVDLLSRIRRFEVTCALEISCREAVVPGFDYYFVPVVLNAGDPRWIVGEHAKALRDFGPLIRWDSTVAEGYVILNENSAAAQLTRAETELDDDDVVAYARLAERLFNFPIFYLEYSGTFGDMVLVKKVAGALTSCQLFYGGGIDSLEKARSAAEAADTIVVGNAVYDNLEMALQTVNAVRTIAE